MEWRWFCCCYLLVTTSRREGNSLRTLAVRGGGRVLCDVGRGKGRGWRNSMYGVRGVNSDFCLGLIVLCA